MNFKTHYVLIDTWNKPHGKIFSSLKELCEHHNMSAIEQIGYRVREILIADYDIDEITRIKDNDV